jgi:hypothetical protein
MDIKDAIEQNIIGQYDVIYHKHLKNADGTARRYKITSIKRWKTKPDVLIGLKRGLYEYHKLNINDMQDFEY